MCRRRWRQRDAASAQPNRATLAPVLDYHVFNSFYCKLKRSLSWQSERMAIVAATRHSLAARPSRRDRHVVVVTAGVQNLCVEVSEFSTAGLHSSMQRAPHVSVTAARRSGPIEAASVMLHSTAPAPATAAPPSAAAVPPRRVPRSIAEVDNGKLMGFSSELSEVRAGVGDDLNGTNGGQGAAAAVTRPDWRFVKSRPCSPLVPFRTTQAFETRHTSGVASTSATWRAPTPCEPYAKVAARSVLARHPPEVPRT